jgi:hypothetical protein
VPRQAVRGMALRSRVTIKYGHGSRGTLNHVSLARTRNNLFVPYPAAFPMFRLLQKEVTRRVCRVFKPRSTETQSAIFRARRKPKNNLLGYTENTKISCYGTQKIQKYLARSHRKHKNILLGHTENPKISC